MAPLLVDPPHLVLDWFQCGMGQLLVVDGCVSLAMCVFVDMFNLTHRRCTQRAGY